GANTDPAGQEGRASLVTDMLEQGAGDLSATEYKRQLDLIGASLGAGAGALTTSAQLNVPSRGFDRAVALFGLALKSPRYDAAEFERVKRLALANIDRRSDSPNTIARLVANRELFGANSVYGRPIDGDRTTVEGLDLAEVQAGHAVLFNPTSARIFVAGSLSEAEVKAALERELGSLRGRSDGAGTLPTPVAPTPQGQRVVIVDRPGAVQTVVNVIAPGVAYGDPNRTGLTAVSTILGGSFTSRLNQNLRERNGYTYGAGSRFGFQPNLGTFGVSTQVRSDVTGASLREILKEIAAIQTGDITSDETTKAATTLRQNEIESLGTLQGLVGSAADLATYGVDFPAGLTSDLSAFGTLNAAGLNSLAKSGIDFSHAVIVLVGRDVPRLDRGDLLENLAERRTRHVGADLGGDA
ncbi:insulinase family protein, partial [bacterium]